MLVNILDRSAQLFRNRAVIFSWCEWCVCGGRRGLDRHLIKSATEARVKWQLEKFSQCVGRGASAASKRPAKDCVHARWCLRVIVYFVSGITYQTQPQQIPHVCNLSECNNVNNTNTISTSCIENVSAQSETSLQTSQYKGLPFPKFSDSLKQVAVHFIRELDEEFTA